MTAIIRPSDSRHLAGKRLRRHGHPVRIVNLALRMMRSRRFDVRRFLARLYPRLFGIDLH